MNHEGTKARKSPLSEEIERLATGVVDAAFKVHSELGPGLLESVYQTCLAHELRKRGLGVELEVGVPIRYDGLLIPNGLRLDMLVGRSIIVELKAVDVLLPVHTAQVLTYLKLSGHRLGLLINFNAPTLKSGIKRLIL